MSEMYNGTAKIPPEKFEFVHSGERIADKKFEDKPIGYFKDAWIRFRKNHASRGGHDHHPSASCFSPSSLFSTPATTPALWIPTLPRRRARLALRPLWHL